MVMTGKTHVRYEINKTGTSAANRFFVFYLANFILL